MMAGSGENGIGRAATGQAQTCFTFPIRSPGGDRPAQNSRAHRIAPLYRIGRLPVLDVVTTIGMLGFDRRARAEAVGLLGLQPGERVLELACGTGRTLPLLAGAVGDSGSVLAVDRSRALVERARRRVADFGNVELAVSDWLAIEVTPPVDAAICVLGLSVIEHWEVALDRLLGALVPGGRLVVVDQLVDMRHSHFLNGYIWLGLWLARAHPDRPIVDATRARLERVTAYRLPMGLQVIAGFND
jgi:SAM-dependent methyltransferase